MKTRCSHGWPIGRCDRCCMHGISLRSGCLVCSPDALSKRVSRNAEKARAVRIKTLKDAVAEAAGRGFRSWEHSPTCDAYINVCLTCDCGLTSFRAAGYAYLAAKEG